MKITIDVNGCFNAEINGMGTKCPFAHLYHDINYSREVTCQYPAKEFRGRTVCGCLPFYPQSKKIFPKWCPLRKVK